MDQLVVCLGGLAFMNFEDSAEPRQKSWTLTLRSMATPSVLLMLVAITLPSPMKGMPLYLLRCKKGAAAFLADSPL